MEGRVNYAAVLSVLMKSIVWSVRNNAIRSSSSHPEQTHLTLRINRPHRESHQQEAPGKKVKVFVYRPGRSRRFRLRSTRLSVRFRSRWWPTLSQCKPFPSPDLKVNKTSIDVTIWWIKYANYVLHKWQFSWLSNLNTILKIYEYCIFFFFLYIS